LEAWIDCGQLAQAATLPSGEMMERLFPCMTDLPEMTEGGKAGWLTTILAHAVASETLDFQQLAGEQVDDFVQVRPTADSGVYRIAVAYRNPGLADAALHEALSLIKAAVRGETVERAQSVLRLWKVAADTATAKNSK